MASPADDGPRIAFSPEAADFLDHQPFDVQAEIIRIIAQLRHSPEVDGETKFQLIGGRTLGGVRQYLRAYADDQFRIVYEFDGKSDPPTLTVLDIVLA